MMKLPKVNQQLPSGWGWMMGDSAPSLQLTGQSSCWSPAGVDVRDSVTEARELGRDRRWGESIGSARGRPVFTMCCPL